MKGLQFRYARAMKDHTKNFDAAGDAGTEPLVSPATGEADAGYLAEKQRRLVAKQQQQAEEAVRRQRAAAKLRENLQRRKQQSRARRAGAADDTDGLPAAKTDESSS